MAVPALISALSTALRTSTLSMGRLSTAIDVSRAAGSTSAERLVNAQATMATGLGGIVGMLAQHIDSLTNEFLDYSTQAAKFGNSFDGVMQEQSASVGSLNDSIKNRFEVALKLNEQGLYGNNAELANLASIQQNLGINSERTIAALRANSLSTGLGSDSMNRLAAETVKLSTDYRVSTERLVAVIKDLQTSNENLALISGANAEAFNKGVMGLAAELGGGTDVTAQLTKFANLLASTDPTTMQRLAAAGLADVQQRIIQATSPTEIQAILKEAAQRAGGTFEMFESSVLAGAATVQQNFGRDLPAVTIALNTALREASQNVRNLSDAAAANVDPRDQLNKLLERAFDPLRQLFFDQVPKILTALTPAIELFSKMLSEVVVFITPFIETLVEITSVVISAAVAVFEFLKESQAFKLFLIGIVPALIAALLPPFILLTAALYSLVVAAVTLALPFIAIGAALYLLYKGAILVYETFETQLKPIVDQIVQFFSVFKADFVTVFEDLVTFGKALAVIFDEPQIALDSFVGLVQRLGAMILDIIFIAPKILSSVASAILDFLPDAIVPDALKEFAEGVPAALDGVTNSLRESSQKNMDSSKQALAKIEAEQQKSNATLDQISTNTKKEPATLPDYMNDLNLELEKAFQELLGINEQEGMLNALATVNETMEMVSQNINNQTQYIVQGNEVNNQVANNTRPRLTAIGDGG